MTKVVVDEVKYNGIVEFFRGFIDRTVVEGVVRWTWPDREIMIPLHNITMIITIVEQE